MGRTGAPRAPAFTEREREYVRLNVGRASFQAMARELGRSPSGLLRLAVTGGWHTTDATRGETRRTAAGWTGAEQAVLLEHYGSRGLSWCLKALPGRSRAAVRRMASKLGMTEGLADGLVRVRDLAGLCGLDFDVVRERARVAGKLSYAGKIPVVPEAWAGRMHRQWGDNTAGNEAAESGYLSPAATARAMGVSKAAVLLAVSGRRKTGPVAEAFAGARIVRRDGRYLVNPWDVETAARRLRSLRQPGWVPAKALAEELGVSGVTVHNRYRAVKRLAIVGGTVTTLVPMPDAAD